MKTFSVFLSFLICTLVMAQNDQAHYLETALANYQKQYLPEKVYVHTDKSMYAAGETIWFAAYLVDGQTHIPVAPSKVVYVDLLDERGKLVQERKLYLDLGSAAGDFSLPGKLEPGDYTIRAFTNYQRNYAEDFFFQKTIKVVPGIIALEEAARPSAQPVTASLRSDKLKLQFYPEGGDCVAGLTCKYAMLAQLPDGTRVETQGRIMDDLGETIAYFKTIGRGTATIPLGPKPGRRYYAIVEYQGMEQEYLLPRALDQGYQLNVETKKEVFVITARTNIATGMKGARLLIHLRGVSIANVELPTEQVAQVKLEEANIPPGVMTATLFDPAGQPVAERLFFVKPQAGDSKIEIEADKATYQRQKPGNLAIRLQSQTKELASAITSVAIVKESFTDVEDENIYSWLLLNSDIQGRIEKPAQFFSQEEQLGGYPLLDALLLTQGWRRFRWQALLNNETPVASYSAEQGLYVKGEFYNLNAKKKTQVGKAFLTVLGDEAIQTEKVVLADGQFEFGPYITTDTNEIVLQARRPRSAKQSLEELTLDDNKYVGIRLEKNGKPKYQLLQPQAKWDQTATQAYQQASNNELSIARNYDSLVIDLDVVEVGAKKTTTRDLFRERTELYIEPDARLIIDSIPGALNSLTLMDIIRRVPGVNVSGPFRQERILIRGVSSINFQVDPLIILDGMPVDIGILRNYPVYDVAFIDILKGPRAAVYGSRASSGVILVYTRRGEFNQIEPSYGVVSLDLPGFYKAREFFIPAQVSKDENRPDIRTTLHWQPLVVTDDRGQAEVEFQTADQAGQYRVIVEGISSDGMPLYTTTLFEVE